MSTIVCPQCDKDDAIQKISAIIDSGKMTGSYSGTSTNYVRVDGKSGTSFGYSHLSGSSITELAKLFEQPIKPIKPHEPSKGGWCSVISAGFFLIFFIFVLSQAITSGGSGIVYVINIGVVILISLVFVFGVYVSYRKLEIYMFEQAKAKYAKASTKHVIDMENYNKAIARWNRLYYCHRNGVVFDPETNETCEAAKVKEFVYQS